ncbi:TPA: type II secretion system F family protein [Candidatus Woesearchaeota archaeon]|jgi:flagellar protein FlaJ|nr:hypothetical protein [archaeon]HIJ11113.1 type II secretion system F family protein [Candidatus Woesearchaeota archaeon]
MVLIPFSILPPRVVHALSNKVMGLGMVLAKGLPYLQLELDRANMKVKAARYLAMCVTASTFLFLFLGGMGALFLSKQQKSLFGVIVAAIVVAFVFLLQVNYPKVASSKRIRKLNTDLLASLRAVMIQLNSGVPLFEAFVIISKQDFGEVSTEFKLLVKKINAGVPQISALEDLALKNPSPYFRRALWQMMNGLKEGAQINQVIDSVIVNLTKEQIIQIERYGSQLSPFAMFYMMGAVILPALGITMLIVISSLIEMDELLLKGLFIGLLVVVLFFQLMFSGIIKTKRPSLLGE